MVRTNGCPPRKSTSQIYVISNDLPFLGPAQSHHRRESKYQGCGRIAQQVMFGHCSNNWGPIGGTKGIRCGQSKKTRGRGGEAQSRGGKAGTWRAKATGGWEVGWSKGKVGADEEDGRGADGNPSHPMRTGGQKAGLLRCAKGRRNRRWQWRRWRRQRFRSRESTGAWLYHIFLVCYTYYIALLY